jgi:hypothetical protein
MALASIAALTLTKGEQVQVEQAAPAKQTKLSPRAKRRMASRGKPRYTKKNKKGRKVKG